MAAIYAVYTSPTHPPIPNHLPTLIVTPHGMLFPLSPIPISLIFLQASPPISSTPTSIQTLSVLLWLLLVLLLTSA